MKQNRSTKEWLGSLPDGSGVSREVHAPFCERPGVRFPRPTQRAPGMARSAVTGAVNQGAKANWEVTWGCKSPGGLDDRNF